MAIEKITRHLRIVPDDVGAPCGGLDGTTTPYKPEPFVSGKPLSLGRGTTNPLPFAKFFAALAKTPSDPPIRRQKELERLRGEMVHWALVAMFPPTPDDSSPHPASKVG